MSHGDIIGVVLAGGLARRMGGGDKGLLDLSGKPVLSHVIERFKPQVSRLVINANGPAGRFADYGLPVVADTIADHPGPLAGVLAGMEWTRDHAPDADLIATVATDAPFIPLDLVARLDAARQAAGAGLACAASGGRHHPVIGLWPVALAGDLRRAMVEDDIRKVDRWTARHRLAIAEFAVEPFDPFFNANRPEDMDEAARIAGGVKV